MEYRTRDIAKRGENERICVSRISPQISEKSVSILDVQKLIVLDQVCAAVGHLWMNIVVRDPNVQGHLSSEVGNIALSKPGKFQYIRVRLPRVTNPMG